MGGGAPQLGLDPAFWRGRRVLLTGHTGFKGGWAALWLHQLGVELTGLALAPTQPSLFESAHIGDVLHSHVVDVRDAQAVARVVDEAQPQLVLHMAAQPLVRRALADPTESFAVNVLGTAHLLQALRSVPDLMAVLVVTSDKVYANNGNGNGHPHVEADRLGGREPYSASKASAELVSAAMAQSFLSPNGVAVATARAGNVIGGGDFAPDRLVPDTVRAALSGQCLALRHPGATRPWQHVLDCIAGYLCYLAALGAGQTLPPALNFGPRLRARATVAQLATAMLGAMGANQTWMHVPDPNSLESNALALDSRLARRTLGWTERLVDKHMIAATATWYQAWARGEDMRDVTLRQISDYQAL